MTCEERLLRSMPMIVSLVIGPNTFIGTLTLAPGLKSGPVTHLIVRSLSGRIQMMVDLSLLSKDANPGEGVIGNAPIHFFYSDDREPAGFKPLGGLAI